MKDGQCHQVSLPHLHIALYFLNLGVKGLILYVSPHPFSLSAFVIGILSGITCGGILREFSGEISSPGYPLDYPDNVTCTWLIPGSSAYLNVSFVDFEVTYWFYYEN